MMFYDFLIVTSLLAFNILSIHCSYDESQLKNEEDDSIYEKHYHGYSVLRVKPTTEKQLKFLKDFSANVTNYGQMMLDFWRKPSSIGRDVDVMVGPDFKAQILHIFEQEQLPFELMISDVESHIDSEKNFWKILGFDRQSSVSDELLSSQNWNKWDARNKWHKGNKWNREKWNKWNRNKDAIETEHFTEYKSYADINTFIDLLVKYDPSYISSFSIGKSFEGREQKLLRIGNSDNKPIVWIDAGTHAREWLGPSTALYIAYQLVDARQKCFVRKDADCPQDVKELLKTFDFHILTVLNPDGYEYTRTKDRLWRKTRSKGKSVISVVCPGVDPNRNYNFSFAGPGTSNNPCSDIYHGERAFSEPEVFNQAKYVMSFTDPQTQVSRVKFYLSLHTYSQLFLLPWGHDAKIDLPQEYIDMEYVALQGKQELFKVDQTVYEVGCSSRILYPAAGSGSDWSMGVPKIKYSYTMELRDKGDNGFVMPPIYIIPTGKETWAAVRKMTSLVATELSENGGQLYPGSKRKSSGGNGGGNRRG